MTSNEESNLTAAPGSTINDTTTKAKTMNTIEPGSAPITKEILDTKNLEVKILCDQKCSRIILAYLRLSQIVVLSLISNRLQKIVRRYFGDCSHLDLSEYYGVIGSPEFDMQLFTNHFLPRFKSVQSLSMRYCSHLKSMHLDSILLALIPKQKQKKSMEYNSNTHESNEEYANTDEGTDENSESVSDVPQHNTILTSLNLYFCSRLGSRALWKIGERLPNLQNLNLGRCYSITAKSNINALKALISLKNLQRLAISLDPSIDKSKAIEIVSVFMDEDSFPKLNCLDLSHGCEELIEIEDLCDLEETRNMQIIRPKAKGVN